ncbi:MAG: Holliday junction branch migration protein RuvA, partial [Clostridia bacterium]
MYSYIKGVLTNKQNEFIVVETGGIGYKISTALTTVQSAGELGNEIKVFTHLHVREDIICLYGFLTQEELNMFELLISVSGVG